MSFKSFFLLLVLLGLIFGAYYLYQFQTSKPLQKELIAIDTNRVNRIILHTPNESIIQLERQDDSWIASNGQVYIRAVAPPVEAILRNLLKIQLVGIAAKSEAEWPELGLAPQQSVRIEIYEEQKLVKDFWIGREMNDQLVPERPNYIRVHQEQEVYAVKGLAIAPFYQDFSAFRSNHLLALPLTSSIDSFSYFLPDTTYIFEKIKGDWYLNKNELLNAEAVNRYLQGLQEVQSVAFVNDFNQNAAQVEKNRSLLLFPTFSEQPILIEAFLDTLRRPPFVLRSIQHPSSFFASDSSGIYGELFWEIEQFLR